MYIDNLILEIKPSFGLDERKIEFVSKDKDVTINVTNSFSKTAQTIKISKDEFQQLVDMISDIDFSKVYFENSGKRGIDGTDTTLTISGGMSCSLAISVWSPHKSETPTETNKLLAVYEKIFDLTSIEMVGL
ncbi:MAG: hypothetical protein IKO46_07535 [Salinivirgaceae bacterium]|nr:hypothetical protein [Salinivirgaceae bacterium]